MEWKADKPTEVGTWMWRNGHMSAFVRVHPSTRKGMADQVVGSVVHGFSPHSGKAIGRWDGEWFGPIPYDARRLAGVADDRPDRSWLVAVAIVACVLVANEFVDIRIFPTGTDIQEVVSSVFGYSTYRVFNR
jgi:hypothetical protein